jgi:hypothetical protein
MPDDHSRDLPDPGTEGRYPLLPGLLDRLDQAALSYTVQAAPASIRVTVRRPGWRWELTFTPDGGVQIQRFRALGGVERDPARLDDLFRDL